MALTSVPGGAAPANDPTRRVLGDQIDEASLAGEYGFVLCHAIMDRLETLQGLHGDGGVHENDNTSAHLAIAMTLASLQLDKLIECKAAITAVARLTASTGAA